MPEFDIQAARARCEARINHHRPGSKRRHSTDRFAEPAHEHCLFCDGCWPCDAGLAKETLAAALEALEEAQAEVKQLTSGFESLRQSLTVMQPEYENTKSQLAEAREEVQRLKMCEGMARDLAAERDEAQEKLDELESAVAVAAVDGWGLDSLTTLRKLAGIPSGQSE